MKIIKSFLIVAVAMGTSTLLHAQELKTEIAKPVESTIPPPGSKPVLAPDAKPESKNVTFQKSEEAIMVTPTPSTRKEEPVKAQPVKSTAVITNEKVVVTQPVMLPASAPAVPKAKENQ